MTDATVPPPARSGARRGARLVAWLVLLALLVALGWRGWQWWQARESHRAAAANAASAQWQALDERLDALRNDQRAQAQRIAQAEAGNRIVREEALGIGQRTARLQADVDKLAGPAREGANALRLAEVELLLAQGAQRLRLAGDLDAAREAYALAAGLLGGVEDPSLLDVRQALAQERAALDALGADPRSTALARLDAFAASLQPPGGTPAAAGDANAVDRPWCGRRIAASRLRRASARRGMPRCNWNCPWRAAPRSAATRPRGTRPCNAPTAGSRACGRPARPARTSAARNWPGCARCRCGWTCRRLAVRCGCCSRAGRRAEHGVQPLAGIADTPPTA